MRLRSIRARLMLWGAGLVALALIVAWAAIWAPGAGPGRMARR